MRRPDRLRWTALCALVAVSACTGAEAEPEGTAEAVVEPVNSLPNPYERIEPWARLPEGMDAWLTDPHSGAEGVDAAGNVYGAVVRRRMLQKHVRR